MDRTKDILGDILTALALLTRLPVRASFRHSARAAWAWPLAGLAVGSIACLAGGLAASMGIPSAIVAGLVVATQVIVTGAMHEDGLADCADGFWGGWDRARRLEIMHDSRIGAYGVLALVLGLGLRWASLAALIGAGHLWAPVLLAAVASRMTMLGLATGLPHARGDGLSVRTGRPGTRTFLGGMVAGGIALALLAPAALVMVVVWGAILGVLCAAIARSKIGGQTGDVLGATQQIGEVGILILLSATLI